MQLRQVLQFGLKRLDDNNVPSPQLAAEILLMHVLSCDRSRLYASPEVEVPDELAGRYFELIDERSTGKPTQYITGHQEFWGLDFEVTPDVLIPRPETEHVIEAVIELAQGHCAGPRRHLPLRMIDVGTGSGAIALALASEFPRATVMATDISPSALDVAHRNAERLGFANRVAFFAGDLLAPILGPIPAMLDFDFVLSNPPYVSPCEIASMQREVRDFEPRIALGGFDQGDEVYRRLLPQALAALKPGGHLVVEIGYNMGPGISALFGDGWTGIEVRPDLAGIPRVVTAEKRRLNHGQNAEPNPPR